MSDPSIRRGPASDALAASVRAPGIFLGLGLGGFLDGIVLHQVLQWHHMLSSTPNHPPTTVIGLEVNTLWDGLFHALAWAVTVLGVVLLWRRLRGAASLPPGRVMVGWMLVGWGAFNLGEGLLNHHLLQIHHVKPGPNQLLFDIAFLSLGALLVVAGMWLSRPMSRRPANS